MKTNRNVPFFDYPQVYLRDKKIYYKFLMKYVLEVHLFYKR